MIVVTGGLGFIGSALVKQLATRGHEIRIIDDLSKGQTPERSQHRLIQTDLRNQEAAASALEGAEICFHLAAKIGGIGYFHKYPATILNDNGLMLASVFNAARQHGTKIVYVSSSMVFERAETFPTPEEAVLSSPPPVTHYGFSKLVGEYYCRAFNEQWGVPYVICRPFNAYGPGEYAENEPGIAHVIPDLIDKTMRGAYPLPIFGSGEQTRCFTFVDDVAEGVCIAGTTNAAVNEDFNIGVDKPVSIRALAEKIWTYSGRTEPFKLDHLTPLNHDIQTRVPDTSKSERILRWRPKVQIDEGLQRTIAWIRDQQMVSS